jgi:hypothetical protein
MTRANDRPPTRAPCEICNVVGTAYRLALLTAASLIAARGISDAQAVITVNDDVNFKLGVLGQFQADWLHDPETDDTAQNLFIRRIRLMFGGQVARRVTFFVETDAPNLGKATPGGSNISPAVIVQDAYAEFSFHPALAIDAGLMFVPFSRNSLQSAATLLPIDYGAYTFTQSAPTQSATGRDTGFQARGYLLANHLEYRAGVFQGRRDAASANSFRVVGRAQYNVLDTETGFFYSGTYLGRKKIFAIGAAVDGQSDFRAYDADTFFDYPIGPGALTARLDYSHFDGGITFVTLPKQDDVLVEAGYLVRAAKLTPVLQWQHRNIAGTSVGDETRTSVGANYWWAAHNASVKAAYTRIAPAGLGTQHEVTIQLQVFYF